METNEPVIIIPLTTIFTFLGFLAMALALYCWSQSDKIKEMMEGK